MAVYEIKAHAVELKADIPKRRVAGYAAVFGNVDNGGDRIHRGAFEKTILEDLPANRIKHGDAHNQMVGLVTHLAEDSLGLEFDSKISEGPDGDQLLTWVADGVYDAASIGFVTIKSGFDESEEARAQNRGRPVRDLTELKLFEVSSLPWGMNPRAFSRMAKGLLGSSLPDFADWTEADLAYLVKHLSTILAEKGEVDPNRVDGGAPVGHEQKGELLDRSVVKQLSTVLRSGTLEIQHLIGGS